MCGRTSSRQLIGRQRVVGASRCDWFKVGTGGDRQRPQRQSDDSSDFQVDEDKERGKNEVAPSSD